IVAVRLCLRAASPAGVNGSLNPGRSLPMLPTGVVSRAPFQYPLRPGCPSAVLGVGRRGADLLSTAVRPRSCPNAAGEYIAMLANSTAAKRTRALVPTWLSSFERVAQAFRPADAGLKPRATC